MPPPPGLTKADVANFIEIYGNEEGGQARFAVYVGKPGAKAWCPVKDLAEARRKAGDINSVQSVAIREGQALVPTISFEAWRAEQQAGGSAEPGKPNGKGKGKAKAKGGSAAGPKPPIADDADDIDALVASIEAAASVDGPSDAHRDADAQTGADAQTSADASSGAEQPPTTQEAEEAAGRRVRIDVLQARPELNGRCGVARRFDVAKGRYEVLVEGEAEPLLLKPANLLDVLPAANEGEYSANEAANRAEAEATGSAEAEAAASEAEAARAAVAAKVAAAPTLTPTPTPTPTPNPNQVAAARAAQALDEAMASSGAPNTAGSDSRKLHLEDLLSAGEAAGLEKSFEKNDKYDHTAVKDFRMQVRVKA